MSIPKLLQAMCAELPDSDLYAIRKARGFTGKEATSRATFASLFVSATGLGENIAILNREEIYTLKLLHEVGEVRIDFFERVYPAANEQEPYEQRYKATLDAVKRNLVRRGLLIMAEQKTKSNQESLQRWRFAVPPEFAAYLPGLPGRSSKQIGQDNPSLLRRKLLTALGGPALFEQDKLPLSLQDGTLYLGEAPLTEQNMQEWKKNAWLALTQAHAAAIETTLRLLNANTWTHPRDVDAALKIYHYGEKTPPAAKLLQTGWELGFLSRLELDRHAHYRLASPEQDQQPDPGAWANPKAKNGAIKVDLEQITIRELAELNTLVYWSVESKVLYANANLPRLGRTSAEQRQTPLARWLAQKSPAFGKAFTTIETQAGKTLLHENLLVARVENAQLRAALEQTLGKACRMLNDQYIAFPADLRDDVEKTIKKNGFVIKTIQA